MLTALDMRWHGAAGGPAAPENRCHPSLEPDDAPEEPGGEEAVAEDGPAMEPELLASTREWMGWRCSYSRFEDSHVVAARYAKYLMRNGQVLQDTMASLPEAQRHKTTAAKLASANLRCEKAALREALRAKKARGLRA